MLAGVSMLFASDLKRQKVKHLFHPVRCATCGWQRMMTQSRAMEEFDDDDERQHRPVHASERAPPAQVPILKSLPKIRDDNIFTSRLIYDFIQ